MEKSPLGHESVVTGVEPFPQVGVFLLFFPLFERQIEVRLAYGEVVVYPLHVHLAVIDGHEIDGRFGVMAGLAELHRTHLPLENDHCAVFHPCFHISRVGPPSSVGPAGSCVQTIEKGHLHGCVAEAAACEKSLAEIAAEIVFQACGEGLGHGFFVALPPVLPDVSAELVHDYAAVRGKGGAGERE